MYRSHPHGVAKRLLNGSPGAQLVFFQFVVQGFLRHAKPLRRSGNIALMSSERFHDQHQSQRGFSFRNQQPLLRGVRLVAKGRTPKPDRLAQRGTADPTTSAVTGTRPAYFGTEFVDTPVHSGPALAPGAQSMASALSPCIAAHVLSATTATRSSSTTTCRTPGTASAGA